MGSVKQLYKEVRNYERVHVPNGCMRESDPFVWMKHEVSWEAFKSSLECVCVHVGWLVTAFKQGMHIFVCVCVFQFCGVV